MFAAVAAFAVAGFVQAAAPGAGVTVNTKSYSGDRKNYITEAASVWEDGEVPTAGKYYVNIHGIQFSSSNRKQLGTSSVCLSSFPGESLALNDATGYLLINGSMRVESGATAGERAELDAQYRLWKCVAIAAAALGAGLFVLGFALAR